MIEIYAGDGKGKTTAAAGLAMRASGSGLPVLFVQFLKDGTSGEIEVLSRLPGVQVVIPEEFYGFVRRMTDEEKQKLRTYYDGLLTEIEQWVRSLDAEGSHGCEASCGSTDERAAGGEILCGHPDEHADGGEILCGHPNEHASGCEIPCGAAAKGKAAEGEQTPSGTIRAVIIMDEALHAVNYGLLDKDRLCKLLDELPEEIEIVLTGRNPAEELVTRADYISEIRCVRHPFEKGIPARKGIEF